MEGPFECKSMSLFLIYLIRKPLRKVKERKQLDLYHTTEVQDKVGKGLARNYQTSHPGVMREGADSITNLYGPERMEQGQVSWAPFPVSLHPQHRHRLREIMAGTKGN